MGNVASTYSALGMHHEALELKEKVLELFKRSLPDDHPDIGTRVICLLGNINVTFSQAPPWAILHPRMGLLVVCKTLC